MLKEYYSNSKKDEGLFSHQFSLKEQAEDFHLLRY